MKVLEHHFDTVFLNGPVSSITEKTFHDHRLQIKMDNISVPQKWDHSISVALTKKKKTKVPQSVFPKMVSVTVSASQTVCVSSLVSYSLFFMC